MKIFKVLTGVCTALFLCLLFPLHAGAEVELARSGQPPETLTEVYLRDGVSYLALEDVLRVLNLSGDWNSVEHVYKIKSPRGTAIISPGSHFLRIGDEFVPLGRPPRFIDGRLRISEDFVTSNIPRLIGQQVYFRNLSPGETMAEEESPLDRLFSFILRKKKADQGGPALRAVALDPGHGGEDPGSIGPGGVKEKTVALGVAGRLEKKVKMRMGIPVYMSRDSDYALNLQKRMENASRSDVDALVLLHAQSSFNSRPKGIHLFIRSQDETEGTVLPAGVGESMRLAGHLRSSLEKSGLKVAGIVQAPLLPLGRGDLPTVLVELGFLSNPSDLELLRGEEGQERVAAALFEGLKAFADERKKETVR